jgi:hypothetical protein
MEETVKISLLAALLLLPACGDLDRPLSLDQRVEVCRRTAASMGRQGYDSNRSYQECLASVRREITEGK